MMMVVVLVMDGELTQLFAFKFSPAVCADPGEYFQRACAVRRLVFAPYHGSLHEKGDLVVGIGISYTKTLNLTYVRQKSPFGCSRCQTLDSTLIRFAIRHPGFFAKETAPSHTPTQGIRFPLVLRIVHRAVTQAHSQIQKLLTWPPRPYRLDQDWIGTVEIAFCGEPSITRSL